jgi:hypothetical protein
MTTFRKAIKFIWGNLWKNIVIIKFIYASFLGFSSTSPVVTVTPHLAIEKGRNSFHKGQFMPYFTEIK